MDGAESTLRGACYHVLARGNARARIYLDDLDRGTFLRTLAIACERTGWRVHAWVLMSNHYHLMLQTPEPNLVAGMQWLQNAYTRRFNVRRQRWGRLFGDRYKAVPVEGEGHYYETLLDYVHLNPVRAGLLRKAEAMREYRWSSLDSGYALPPQQRPTWLACADGLAAFGCPDTAAGRRRFVERLEARRRGEQRARCGIPELDPAVDARRSTLRDGWYWGSQAFAERLLALGETRLHAAQHRHSRGTAEKRAHGEAEAYRLLSKGLQALGWTREDLQQRPGSAPAKVALARQIWESTTVSLTWLSEHLAMKSAANASQQIRRHRQLIS